MNDTHTVQECLVTCIQTYAHCITLGGPHVEAKHLGLLTDCIKICETTIYFMARQSDNHQKVCAVCAEICASCAESCAALEGEQMQKCADACKKCAETCRAMAA